MQLQNLVVTLNEEKEKRVKREPLNREIIIADLLSHTSASLMVLAANYKICAPDIVNTILFKSRK
jgi:hypothetical protein